VWYFFFNLSDGDKQLFEPNKKKEKKFINSISKRKKQKGETTTAGRFHSKGSRNQKRPLQWWGRYRNMRRSEAAAAEKALLEGIQETSISVYAQNIVSAEVSRRIPQRRT
jgi:hypothetical protein